ncbi:MAG: hypothetical protein U1E39_08925 [Planctomycetota bacterium]
MPLAGCKTSWELESRDTPVHVIVVAPAAAQAPQRVPLLVYVGDRKAVDGTLSFPQGTTRLETPTVHVRSGEPTVSVVLGGRTVATGTVTVKRITWIVITIAGDSATIASSDQDPTAAR